MPLTFVSKTKPEPPPKTRRSGNTRARAVTFDINLPGRLRSGHLQTLYSVSAVTLYRHLKDGRVPPPDGHDPKPYWLTSTVRKHLES